MAKSKKSGYTGRKLNNYIWIPKSKTDLREFREILKICFALQQKSGYFSDKTLGQEMVSLRAIVDRDNTPDSYIEKYGAKSIGNQSYTSNARMMLRILRWLGLVTKDYDPEVAGKFYLTTNGKRFANFSGSFPDKNSLFSESDLFEEAFAKMRFYSVNDDIRYRNSHFKQRFFYNMIKTLGALEFASHYELALSALTLRDDSNKEFKDKIDKILMCRSGKKNVRWLMKEYGLDCDNKSTLTGIYDGPKVLLSFAKQFGLAEEINLSSKSDKNKKIIEMYSKMYSKSGHISPKSIKKCTRITEKGKKFLEKYQNGIQVWFYDIKREPEKNSAILLLCQKNGHFDFKNGDDMSFIDTDLLEVTGKRATLKKEIDFDLYRDVPYEKRREVIDNIKTMNAEYFKKEEAEVIPEGILCIPNEKPNKRCIECAFQSCGVYSGKQNAFGGRDRFASRVCPENLLTFNDFGQLLLDSEKCVGCGLCLINCSFDGIDYDRIGVFSKINNKVDVPKKLNKDLKDRESEKIKAKYNDFRFKIKIEDIPVLLRNFIHKINLPERKWDKDRCYVYVRNIFKIFGVEAIYSGSGGMKTRSDVTIESPFIAVSEVKSPAESPINMKAVRQAFDAGVQQKTKLTMAIGLETHTGAKDQELKYRETTGMGILLLEIKYLAFMLFISEYFNFNPESLKYLIENYKGHFTEDSLRDFLCKQKSTLNKSQIEDLINRSFSS